MHQAKMTRRLWRALAVAAKLEREREVAEKQRSKPVSAPSLEHLWVQAWARMFFAGPNLFAAWLKVFAP